MNKQLPAVVLLATLTLALLLPGTAQAQLFYGWGTNTFIPAIPRGYYAPWAYYYDDGVFDNDWFYDYYDYDPYEYYYGYGESPYGYRPYYANRYYSPGYSRPGYAWPRYGAGYWPQAYYGVWW